MLGHNTDLQVRMRSQYYDFCMLQLQLQHTDGDLKYMQQEFYLQLWQLRFTRPGEENIGLF